MRICVFMSGGLSNGLDSPTAGEGRWGQNLAKMLALNGHLVDCIAGSPFDPMTWGSSAPIDNVTLYRHINPNILYDLALYFPWEYERVAGSGHWEPCTVSPLKSKWYVHCQFGWASSVANDHICYKNNHVLAYPSIQDSAQFPPSESEENPFKTFALPIPIYDRVADLNLENRTDLMWSCKGVFDPGWGSTGHHCPKIGLRTLKAIKRLSENYDFTVHFLSSDTFYPENSWISRDLGVMDIVNSIPNKVLMHRLLPRDVLMGIMRKTRVTTIVSGLLGSYADSICMGAVPLCYDGHQYRAAAEKHALKLNTYEATEFEIYNCIERLYIDDVFYKKVIEDYQYELRYYSFDESYKYFLKMVDALF